MQEQEASGASKDLTPEPAPVTSAAIQESRMIQCELEASGLIGTAVSATESVFSEHDEMVCVHFSHITQSV